MRGLYLMLFFLAIIPGCKEKEKVQEPMQVFLLLGQSNMAGRGEISDQDTIIFPGVYLFNDQDEWEPAKQPLNKYSTIRKELKKQGYNLGHEMGRYLHDKTGYDIGLIINARGGSSIKQWHKDSLYYKEAVQRALAAKNKGVLKAIIWQQGGSDKRMGAPYVTKLRKLTEAFREDLNDPVLPIFVGELGEWRASARKFNSFLADVSDSIPNAFLVRANDLVHKEGDSLHFDTKSLKLFGERYANAVLTELYYTSSIK